MPRTRRRFLLSARLPGNGCQATVAQATGERRCPARISWRLAQALAAPGGGEVRHRRSADRLSPVSTRGTALSGDFRRYPGFQGGRLTMPRFLRHGSLRTLPVRPMETEARAVRHSGYQSGDPLRPLNPTKLIRVKSLRPRP